jgi:hypothetical protein
MTSENYPGTHIITTTKDDAQPKLTDIGLIQSLSIVFGETLQLEATLTDGSKVLIREQAKNQCLIPAGDCRINGQWNDAAAQTAVLRLIFKFFSEPQRPQVLSFPDAALMARGLVPK